MKHLLAALLIVILLLILTKETFLPFAGILRYNQYRDDPAFDNIPEWNFGRPYEISPFLNWQLGA